MNPRVAMIVTASTAILGLLGACQAPGSAPDMIACAPPPEQQVPASAPTLSPSIQGPLTNTIRLNAVLYGDGLSRQTVAVQNLGTRRTETGTLSVMAALMNCSGSPIAARARLTLLDKHHQPVEPTSPWKQVLLSPGGIGWYLEHSATDGDVDSYLIEIGRDVFPG
ncbi:MAG: hypothetical protein R3E87_22185 [Burkholderiaceae bacterium]